MLTDKPHIAAQLKLDRIIRSNMPYEGKLSKDVA
jgi:hypothetical protein